jgi:Protein of unknown function (DUF2628)
MPVYTVHAPLTSNVDLRATDRFIFVRDGFHVWAALFGPVWLAWHRLWLALIGWVVLLLVVDVAMVRFSVGSTAIFLVACLLALLLGFEAASVERWTLSRRNWRQLDIVVADDAEAAERRFFDRWTAKQRVIGDDKRSVERGAPPPTRDVPGQAFSKAPPREDIIGLFPQPGASR